MIRIDSLSTSCNINDVQEYLQSQTDNFGLFLDLDRLIEYQLHFTLTKNTSETKLRKLMHNPMYNLTENNVSGFLMDAGIPEYKFRDKYDKRSFAAEVRVNLSQDESIDEELREVVKLYHEYKTNSYLLSYLPQYMNLPICDTPSYNGHRMVIAHPTWNILRTYRLSAASPSMQNIPRYMKDIITSPYGWRLKRCDSDQIEPRITYSWYIPDELISFLITEYMDAYAGIMHFSELTSEEDALLRKDKSQFKKLDLGDNFSNVRQDYKKLTLSANYGSEHLMVEPAIAAKYKNRIVNHPLRLQKEREVEEAVRRGTETFYTAFGNPIYVEETARYKRGTKAWPGHVVRCGINNPIQGTASELMLFSVTEARKVIDEHPDTHIAFYKHDEGAFYVKEEQEAEVTKLLEEITAYQVKGWIPITCALEDGQLMSKEVESVL